MYRLSNDFISKVVFPSGIKPKVTRPLLIMLISWGILVFVYVQLLMMLRMVYWCTPIGITLQRSISYTLASYGRNCLLYFLSKHMCKLQSKLLAHMQGEQLLPYGIVHILLHIVNMFGQATWIQLNFNSYLCERVVINYQKGRD